MQSIFLLKHIILKGRFFILLVFCIWELISDSGSDSQPVKVSMNSKTTKEIWSLWLLLCYSVWQLSVTLVHTQLAAPLSNAACIGQYPSPTQAQCLLLPDQILSSPNCKQCQKTDNNNRAENAPPLPTSKRRNKKTDEEKQRKNKVEGAVGFVRTQEQHWDCCFSAG